MVRKYLSVINVQIKCTLVNDVNLCLILMFKVVKHEESWSNDKNDFSQNIKTLKKKFVFASMTRRRGFCLWIKNTETCRWVRDSNQILLLPSQQFSFSHHCKILYWFRKCQFFCVLSVFSRGWKTLYASKWVFLWGKSKHSMWVIYSEVKLLSPSLLVRTPWWHKRTVQLSDPSLSSWSPRWPATGRTPTSWWWPWTPRVLWTRQSGSWPTSGCPGPWRTGPWCWWQTRPTSSRAGPSNPWRESRSRYTTTSSTLRHLRVNRYDWARYNNWISLYLRD